MKSRVMILDLMAVVLVAGSAFACGPFFDDAYLVRGSEQEFLSMPEGDFKYELEAIAGNKMVPQAKEEPDYHAMRANTASADINDLKEAMKSLAAPDWQKEKAIQAYGERRAKISEYLKGYVPINPWKWYGDQFRSEEKRVGGLKIVIGSESPFLRLVPREFILYSEGAIAYHNNDFDAAIKKWKELLGLPEGQRKYRSVWSAFMIGKAYLSLEKNKEVIPYFEMARKLASDGYRDSLNLAQESYGWQALAEYETGDYAASIKHYLKNIDVVSMYRVCRTIASLGESDFENVVKDETVLRVLVGWVMSHSSYYFYSNDENENENYIHIATRLTTVIEKNSLKISSNNADRVAWMFYNLGKFGKADSWLKISKEQSALSQWIRAKLLIREGKVDKAIEIMRNLKHSFVKDEEFNRFYGKISTDVERKINTEHSILLLSRNDYMMAFGVLLEGAYWEDIAYVAEKVLTAGELEAYLKSHDIPGDEKALGFCYAMNIEKPTVENALKYLLARRFARNSNWQKAIEYMPVSFKQEEYAYNSEQSHDKFSPQEKLQNCIAYMEKAKNQSLTKKDRAFNYFKAAQIMRKYGMEIFGTELDPDWFVFNGQFDYDRTPEARFAVMTKEREDYYKGWYDEIIKKTKERREKILKERNIFDASKKEEDRVLASMPDPYKRFHYRYKAADLMWKCAELLPNNDKLKAKALCLGGTYLKYRDKEEADKFYKALVKTCGDTKLGKEADKLRWFPKIAEAI